MTHRSAGPKAQHKIELLPHPVGAGPVGFIDDEQVRHFDHTSLEHLDAITRLGNQNQDGRVGAPGHIELRLSDTDRLDQDPVEPGRIEHIAHFAGRGRQATKGTAGRHRADVYAIVQGDRFHSDPVAQERPPGEWAGRIDGNHRNRKAAGPVGGDQLLGQGGFPGARRAGEPDAAGMTQRGVKGGQQLLEPMAAVLHDRYRPGQSGHLAGPEIGEKRFQVHAGKSHGRRR